MTDIHAMDILAALQKVEERGALEAADRVLMLARQVWTYWLPTTDIKPLTSRIQGKPCVEAKAFLEAAHAWVLGGRGRLCRLKRRSEGRLGLNLP